MTTARGAGCGKVILLGEHSVVHGRPALAAGLSRGATAEVSASTDGLTRARFVFDTAEVDVLASQDADHSLGRALAALLATYTEPPPMQLTVRLELPAGAGLGASAAMGVAVSAALDQHLGVARTPEERATQTLAWERVFHGNPSGVDNTMAAVGGVAFFTRGRGAGLPGERAHAAVVPLEARSARGGSRESSKPRRARREARRGGKAIHGAHLGALLVLGGGAHLVEHGHHAARLSGAGWAAVQEHAVGAQARVEAHLGLGDQPAERHADAGDRRQVEGQVGLPPVLRERDVGVRADRATPRGTPHAPTSVMKLSAPRLCSAARMGW